MACPLNFIQIDLIPSGFVRSCSWKRRLRGADFHTLVAGPERTGDLHISRFGSAKTRLLWRKQHDGTCFACKLHNA